MIVRLNGIVIEKLPAAVVIEVDGISYEVAVSMQTLCALPDINKPVILHTHMIVREDAQLLFGFATHEERASFRALLKVSGIGAKTALGILSALSDTELAAAITSEDVRRLSSVPGIGKKTAERIILELRGKLSAEMPSLFSSGSLNTSSNLHNDIIDTLLALGYSEREATVATQELPPDIEVGAGVKLALKTLNQ